MKKGLIRWNFLIPLGLVLVLILGYAFFFFDRHFRAELEAQLTEWNDSEVNIASLKTGWLTGSLELKGLEFSDPTAREWNRLEVGRLRLEFTWQGLLHRKWIIQDALASDIKVQVKRRFVAKAAKRERSPLSLMSMESSAHIQESSQFIERGTVQDPFQDLKWDATPSRAATQGLEAEIQAFTRSWQGRVEALPDTAFLMPGEAGIRRVKTGESQAGPDEQVARARLAEIKSSMEQLNEQSTQLLNRIQSLDDLVEQDALVLRQYLAVPSLDFKDLAMELSLPEAKRWLRFVESYYGYWREQLEAREQVQPYRFGRQQGSDFRFIKTSGDMPFFWVKNLQVTSTETAEGTLGTVSGKLSDLTSDPALVPDPTRFLVQGEFKQSQILGLVLDVSLDHRTATVDDRIALTLASFPVHGRMLTSSPSLTLGLYQAEGSMNLEFIRQGEQSNAHFRSNFERIVYRVESGTQRVKDVFDEILGPVQAIQIDADGQGTFPKLRWTFASNLADRMKEGLQQKLGQEVAELHAKLKDAVLVRIGDEKKRLSASLIEQLGPIRDQAAAKEAELAKVIAERSAEKQKGI